MLLIRNEADSKSAFSAEQELAFLNACKVYIENLIKNGNLIGAQPLVRDFLRLHAGELNISEAACLGDCDCPQVLRGRALFACSRPVAIERHRTGSRRGL